MLFYSTSKGGDKMAMMHYCQCPNCKVETKHRILAIVDKKLVMECVKCGIRFVLDFPEQTKRKEGKDVS